MRVWGVVHEPGPHRAHVVVVHEQVERDEYAYGRREPREGERGLDHFDCKRTRMSANRSCQNQAEVDGNIKGEEERRQLTEAECPEREEDDGERDEDGARCARDAVPEAFEPFEAAEDASCEASRHPSPVHRARAGQPEGSKMEEEDKMR